MHVKRIVMGHLVNQHTVGKLNCQAVAIQRNFFYMIFTSYSDLLLCDKVLNDHVSHDFSVRVSILIQTVDSAEYNLVHGNCTIVAPTDNVVMPWTDSDRPHPVLFLTNVTQVDHVATHQLHLLVGPTKHEVLTIGKETDAAGIKIQLLFLPAFLTGNLVGRESLVPAADNQYIHRIRLRRHGCPLQAPDWRTSHHLRLLRAKLVSDGHVPVEQPESQMQSVRCPRHTQNLRVDPVLRHRLLFGGPQPQINCRATGQLLGDWVVVKALDGVAVVIFQHTLRYVGPNDDVFVR
mmetsp:Transcript_38103/g.91485  ORF Transcript_38103/g.91485 Transcript_38103/m.91485 type:complete len:291 (+) Transcript_38103:2794-3666(+)